MLSKLFKYLFYFIIKNLLWFFAHYFTHVACFGALVLNDIVYMNIMILSCNCLFGYQTIIITCISYKFWIKVIYLKNVFDFLKIDKFIDYVCNIITYNKKCYHPD